MPTGIHLSKALIAANATLIAASQTPGAAGALTLTSTAVVLDTQRRVIITSAGNNSGVTFTITGVNDSGLPRVETVAGANAGVSASLYDYRTVTSVTISAASTGAVTVGTNTTGSSDWKLVDSRTASFSMSVACTVTGTITYGLETTNSSFLAIGNPTAGPFIQATTIAASAASAIWVPAALVRAWRITITAGTGTVFADAQQTSEH